VQIKFKSETILRLRSVHVLPKQQRPLRSLLHYAASILSLCRRTPLRHKQIFGTIPTEPLDGLITDR
ncbi:MAG: hypothetical protein IKO55_02715, partial [Kiritimatiellae bacterium]|nr:hypothetical protein [Kiritimatiellia bacterium]